MSNSRPDLPPNLPDPEKTVVHMDEFIARVSKEGLRFRINWEMRHPEGTVDDTRETEDGPTINWRTERDKDIIKTYAEPIGRQRPYTPELAEILDPSTPSKEDEE
jgi:hypothetical protein